MSPTRALRAVSLSAVAVAALAVLGVVLGPPVMSPAQIWSSLPVEAPHHVPVVELRLPRAALAVAVGAALGMVGALTQDALRNPIAGPELTGATSASALVLALATVTGQPTGLVPQILCAAGLSLVVSALVVTLAGRIRDPRGVVVLGATTAAVLAAVTVAVVAMSTETSVTLLYTVLSGNLASRSWPSTPPALVALAVAVVAAALLARRVDTLRVDEALASTVGARPVLTRAGVLVTGAVVCAGTVLVCGPVPFVALAAPHLARAALRTSRSTLVAPAAGATGAALVLVADAAARWVAAPGEIPVGVPASLIGGVVVLAALRRVRVTA